MQSDWIKIAFLKKKYCSYEVETKYIAIKKNFPSSKSTDVKSSDETFWFQIAIYVYITHICTYTYIYTLTMWSISIWKYIYLACHLNLGDVMWGKQAQPVNLYRARLSHPSLTPLQLNFWAIVGNEKAGAKGQNTHVHFNPATFYLALCFSPQVKSWRLIKVICIYQISFMAKASFESSLHCLWI